MNKKLFPILFIFLISFLTIGSVKANTVHLCTYEHSNGALRGVYVNDKFGPNNTGGKVYSVKGSTVSDTGYKIDGAPAKCTGQLLLVNATGKTIEGSGYGANLYEEEDEYKCGKEAYLSDDYKKVARCFIEICGDKDAATCVKNSDKVTLFSKLIDSESIDEDDLKSRAEELTEEYKDKCDSGKSTTKTCKILYLKYEALGNYADENQDDEVDAYIDVLIERTTRKIPEPEYSATGCSLLDTETGQYVSKALNLMRIAGVILVIVFGMLDFIKSVTAGDENAMKKSKKNFFYRLIALLILLLLPVVIEQLIFNNISVTDVEQCKL